MDPNYDSFADKKTQAARMTRNNPKIIDQNGEFHFFQLWIDNPNKPFLNFYQKIILEK